MLQDMVTLGTFSVCTSVFASNWYTDIDVTTIDAASCISYTERMGFQEVHQSKISLVGLL